MKQSFAIALLLVGGAMALSPAIDITLQVWSQQQAALHATMPCCARLATGDACRPETPAPLPATHCNRHSDEDHGQCSSLCHCQCCQHIVSILWVDLPVLSESPVQTLRPTWHRQYHFDYIYLIWQPPRLS